MSILRKAFKIFNGSSWDEYHLKTDSKQVVHTKADGTDTTVEEQLLALNSTLEKINKTSGILTLNYDYGCYYYKNGNVVTITIDFGNKSVPQSGIILGTLKEKYRPSLDVFTRNSYDNQNGMFYIFKNGNVGIISSSGPFNYMTATLSYVAATGFDM